ncbi:hypothetical protein BH20CHL3_BH20CHL3_05480 [soil metagenome]
MSARIDRRDDVKPERGAQEYGDVEFADPVNNKYPIDNRKHIRAAWSYINHQDNAAKYDKDEVETIKERIVKAAKKHDIEIDAGEKG